MYRFVEPKPTAKLRVPPRAKEGKGKNMATIGFIGMGNMGTALLKGALKAFTPTELVYTARTDGTKQRITSETGVPFAPSNAECANACKYLILAVKPQFYDEVLKQIHYVITPEHVVISLAPGITIAKLQERLGSDRRIVRAMPNTPALIGEGITGLAYTDSDYQEEEIAVLEKLFGAVGRYQKVDEKLMSAVVCASGSSPAFAYMFMEALADGVVQFGMPRKEAYAFVAQALAGAARMVLETGQHPGVLPGGPP